MRHLKTIFYNFFRGIIVAGPVFLTLYIAIGLFNWIDHLLPVREMLPETIVYIPGIGLISLFLFFVVIGHFCKYLAFSKIFERISSQFLKVPFLKFLFSSIKDVFNAFNKKESKLNKPVLVKLSEVEAYKIGFLVKEDLSILGLNDHVTVYFPHSFAFSGNTVIVHKKQIQQTLPSEISPSEVLKFIVSGGIANLEKQPKKEKHD